MSLSVCLSLCLSVCQSVCLSVGRSVGRSVCLSVLGNKTVENENIIPHLIDSTTPFCHFFHGWIYGDSRHGLHSITESTRVTLILLTYLWWKTFNRMLLTFILIMRFDMSWNSTAKSTQGTKAERYIMDQNTVPLPSVFAGWSRSFGYVLAQESV